MEGQLFWGSWPKQGELVCPPQGIRAREEGVGHHVEEQHCSRYWHPREVTGGGGHHAGWHSGWAANALWGEESLCPPPRYLRGSGSRLGRTERRWGKGVAAAVRVWLQTEGGAE